MQLFVLAQPAGTSAPVVDPDATEPFADPRWRPLAPDAPETLVGGAVGDEALARADVHRRGLHHAGARADPDRLRPRDAAPVPAGALRARRRLSGRTRTLADALREHVRGHAGRHRVAGAPVRPGRRAGRLAAVARRVARGSSCRRRGTRAAAGARSPRRSHAPRGAAPSTACATRSATKAGVEAVIEEPIVQTGWWALADDGRRATPRPRSRSSASAPCWPPPSRRAPWSARRPFSTASFLAPQEEYAHAAVRRRRAPVHRAGLPGAELQRGRRRRGARVTRARAARPHRVPRLRRRAPHAGRRAGASRRRRDRGRPGRADATRRSRREPASSSAESPPDASASARASDDVRLTETVIDS